MKKVMFVMAVAGMFAFAACNNAQTEEPAVDSTAMVEEEATAEEEVANDSTVEAAAEETAECTEANAQ